MCGIAGFVNLQGEAVEFGEAALSVMGRLLSHRGPDGYGEWIDSGARVGFAHRRLAIIDLSPAGAQPMQASNGTVITFNGEIYNYLELHDSLDSQWELLHIMEVWV